MIRIPLYAPRAPLVLAYALVDDDQAHLAKYRWCLSREGYAERRSGGSRILMHRAVLGLSVGDGVITDHINRSRLDNRGVNLRRVTAAESAQNKGAQRRNRSGIRGAQWDKAAGKWKAAVRIGGRTISLGYHDCAEAAGSAASAWRASHMPFSYEGEGRGQSLAA